MVQVTFLLHTYNMNKTSLVLLGCFIAGSLRAQTTLISQNFDGLSVGSLVAQTLGAPWNTWSIDPGGTEDAAVSNEEAFSGTRSLKVTYVTPTTYDDVLLALGYQTSGRYALSWQMYVPFDYEAYFNLQHSYPGLQYAMEVTFDDDGTGYITTDDTDTPLDFPVDAWFHVAILIDLDAATGTITVADNPSHAWAFDTQSTGGAGTNQLSFLNLPGYAGGGPSKYFIDDLTYVNMTGVGLAENTLMEVGAYPNPTRDILTVDMPAGPRNAVASLVDATGRTVIEGRSFQQNANVARTQLDLQGLSEGVYFLRVRNGSEELVRRVTKL